MKNLFSRLRLIPIMDVAIWLGSVFFITNYLPEDKVLAVWVLLLGLSFWTPYATRKRLEWEQSVIKAKE